MIFEADPNAVMIPWPAGAAEPQKGRVYWLQSEEDAEAIAEKAKAQREYSPGTCAEVLAGMHRRLYGKEPERKKKKRRRPIGRPKAGDARLVVIDTAVLDIGWEAKVALYEDPDPVAHLRVKAKVPAGPNPIEGFQEPTELEPEQIITPSTRARREEEEQALRIEHRGSIDRSEVVKAEQKLIDQRRRGKSGKLAEEALERAKKRASAIDAAGGV